MKKTVSFDINLLPKDPFFATPVGKVLRWALSVGRYIVIFTELVVILSFVTRFSLDRQVTDLNEQINQKKTIILSYGELEEDIKQVQTVLAEYSQIKSQVNITEVFPELTNIMPRDTELKELIIRPDKISFSGSITSQQSLNTLINNIQISQHFFNVSVDKIESETIEEGGGFSFVIRADTKQEVKQAAAPSAAEQTNILNRTDGADGV